MYYVSFKMSSIKISNFNIYFRLELNFKIGINFANFNVINTFINYVNLNSNLKSSLANMIKNIE